MPIALWKESKQESTKRGGGERDAEAEAGAPIPAAALRNDEAPKAAGAALALASLLGGFFWGVCPLCSSRLASFGGAEALDLIAERHDAARRIPHGGGHPQNQSVASHQA